jgi:hypothetical protein|uniref:Uncharacterized protein n=1 Tax=Podoviridae sp. ctz6O13 TaxID=2827757 RepID=A0A8S5TKB2_9CAUD|nr:MAG TPA: hypothetical protein [Podoviridae sp. ctz6O13]
MIYGYENYKVYEIRNVNLSEKSEGFHIQYPIIREFLEYENKDSLEYIPKFPRQKFIFNYKNSTINILSSASLRLEGTPDVTDKSLLYFIDNSKYPFSWRNRFGTAVPSKSKADYIVLPNEVDLFINTGRSVFINDARKTILILYWPDVSSAHIGQTFMEWLDSLDGRIRERILFYDKDITMIADSMKEVKCSYIGDMLWIDKKDSWLYDVLQEENENFITERELLELSAKEENDFTLQMVDEVLEDLREGNYDKKVKSLKRVADMNFFRYPSVAKYILKRELKPPFGMALLGEEMTYMYYYLTSIMAPFKTVTGYEYDLVKVLYERHIRNRIESLLYEESKYTNLKVNCNFNIDVIGRDTIEN